MASSAFLRDGSSLLPSASSTTQFNSADFSNAPCSAERVSAPRTPRRLVLPTRYMKLEPAQPLSAINDDPVFDARSAAIILGVTYERLTKWRLANQGPDYIRYGQNGPIRYALSAPDEVSHPAHRPPRSPAVIAGRKTAGFRLSRLARFHRAGALRGAGCRLHPNSSAV